MGFVLEKDAQLCLVTQLCCETSSDLRSLYIDWQKGLNILRNALKVQKLPYDLITQRIVLSSTTIKIRAMEPNNMTIYRLDIS